MPSGAADPTRRIAVGGEALIDLVVTADGVVTEVPGGGPFNAARTMARLGAGVSFCGAVSTDARGERLRSMLADDGVDLSIASFVDLPTPTATAHLDRAGHASYTFDFAGTAAPSYAPPPALSDLAALHVGTLGLVLEPMATTYRTMVDDAADDVVVFVDPNCRPAIITDRAAYLQGMAPVLTRADVVKVSDDDLAYLAPGEPPAGAAARLVTAGATVVLVTLGAAGCLVVTASSETLVAQPPVTVVDTIGAGDSFGGAFIAWWVLNGLGRDELSDVSLVSAAVAAAQQVAGIVCTRVGAQPPRRDELPADWLSTSRPFTSPTTNRA